MTYCATNYNYNWRLNANKYILSFTTECYFVPSRSWSVKSKQTPELLRHEQVHFDIAEFFTRLLLQTLNKQTYTENYKAEIELVYQDIAKKKQAMQDLYDTQTNHSKNEVIQAQWEQYIASILRTKNLNVDAAAFTGTIK